MDALNDEWGPVAPVGPPVDPWADHPLFPARERYAGFYSLMSREKPTILYVPVIPGREDAEDSL